MTELREGLSPLPERMKELPIESRGFPVPRFVHIQPDGKPDFRIISEGWLAKTVNQNRCWVCGQRLGAYKAYVIGPMCAVNRTTSEPPCHLECADWSAINCPFLSRPEMKRNAKSDVVTADETHTMTEHKEMAPIPGIHLDRNPGVACVWTTKEMPKPFRPYGGNRQGILFKLPLPVHVAFYARGRHASREEVLASIDSGMPLLRNVAAKEDGALEVLERQYKAAMVWLPKAA